MDWFSNCWRKTFASSYPGKPLSGVLMFSKRIISSLKVSIVSPSIALFNFITGFSTLSRFERR